MVIQLMRKHLPLFASLFCVALSVNAETEQEEKCNTQLTRFMGLQAHVAQEGPTAVPQFMVGLTPDQIQVLVEKKGYCAAWKELQLSLQKQHGSILDATEKKTGKPSPIR